jgi:elongation factor Ts
MPIDPHKLKELREMTGAGMLDCKDALEQTGGDLDKAREILRKKGMDRAGKLSTKEAKVGRVFAYVHTTDSQKGRFGALVELTCQTDFVVKSPEFDELIKDIAMHIGSANPRYIGKEDVPAAEIEVEKAKYAEEIKGKPEPVAQKIIQGKLDKLFFSAYCLLSQNFVNEAKFKGTIEQLLKEKTAKFGENIEVRRFARFEVGKESTFSDRTQKKV